MIKSLENYNPFSLKGKNILITGASSGIGKAIALECSRMDARVFITGRNPERLNDVMMSLRSGNESISITADLRTEDGIEAIAEKVDFLDGIVHCAGIGDRTLSKMIRKKDIERVMDTNFNAPVLLQRALLKKKKVKKGASIVFIASRAPFAPTIGNGLYSASKGALIAYSKVLGLELAPRKIRVNSICPAMVWTNLVEKDAALMGADYHEAEKSYPLGRYGKPEDIAYLAIYLLSDCSEWMTGSCIDVTGGGIHFKIAINMACIKAISYFLPKMTVTNEQLVAEFPEWSVEKIVEKVGVKQRHIASEETISDMAVNASEKLLAENSELDRRSIDFVLVCTQSPDYFLPSTACIVQNRLGLSTRCGAFDFNLGCSGYEYGLAVAKGLIETDVAKNILFITSEAYNKHLHPRDKGNRTIFGDAATATLISNEGFAEIGDFVLGTDGSGAENLIVRTGGMAYPEKANDLIFDEDGNPHSSDYLYMNGGEIFYFTLMTVPKMVKQTLEKNNLTKDDIDLYVFHQANKFMLNHLRKKLKIEEDKFFINMENIGNTVSSTVPIALADAKQEGKLKGNVLIAGFGVGLSWGATIIKIV